RVAARRMEHLRRDPQLVGAPLATPAPDPLLAAAAAVGVAGVEPADPAGPGSGHDRESGLLVRALAEERRRRPDPAEVPAAERESSQLSGAWSHRDAASRSIARVDGGYGPVAVARSMAWYIRTAGLAAGQKTPRISIVSGPAFSMQWTVPGGRWKHDPRAIGTAAPPTCA